MTILRSSEYKTMNDQRELLTNKQTEINIRPDVIPKMLVRLSVAPVICPEEDMYSLRSEVRLLLILLFHFPFPVFCGYR